MEPKPSTAPLPNAPCIRVNSRITIQPPLSRRGVGPGLLLVVDESLNLEGHEKTLDPPPLLKWAEEGYAVAQILAPNTPGSSLGENLGVALTELKKLESWQPRDKLSLIVIQREADDSLGKLVDSYPEIVSVVYYGHHPQVRPSRPILVHLPKNTGPPLSHANQGTQFSYQTATGAYFTIPAHDHYVASAAAIAHTRSLTFLKPLMGGPYFDLEKIWDEHTFYEFGDRSVEDTMATMVQEPYVNHVPTLTGGIGRDRLTKFYRDHFIFSNPDDSNLELVSRTVGIDRVIDEFLFNCTHDKVIDALVPGVPPTGKPLSFPCTSIVNFRGDRLFHEHIAWDQGTVLRQLGLLPEYLPFPYALPDGRTAGPGREFQYRVPVGGVETAQKLVDENSVESNQMIEYVVREVEKEAEIR